MGQKFSTGEKQTNPATQQNQATNVAQQPAAPVQNPGIQIKIGEFAKEDLKILILGPGESGKSTYWRQLRNIYTGGLSTKEKKNLIIPIRMNLIHDIQVILEYAESLQLDISTSLASEVQQIRELDENDVDELTDEVAHNISLIWDDPAAKEVYKQIHSCNLSDHTDFFLDNTERIAKADYLPSNEDVIKSRIRTTGVNDIKMDINGRKILLVDVGGQQCERGKWKNVFNNVNAIIFVISLADFDQTMFEDQKERRTVDSLELFKQTVANPLFQKIPFYLIMNKQDEFERKLKAFPDAFKQSYPGFDGNLDDVDSVIKYIENQYISQTGERQPGAEIKTFVTTALNADKLNQTFLSVSENVLKIPQQ